MTNKSSFGGSPKGIQKSINEIQSVLKKSKSTNELGSYSDYIDSSSPLRNGTDCTHSQPSTPNYADIRTRSKISIQKLKIVKFDIRSESSSENESIDSDQLDLSQELPSINANNIFIIDSNNNVSEYPEGNISSKQLKNKPTSTKTKFFSWKFFSICLFNSYFFANLVLVSIQISHITYPYWNIWKTEKFKILIAILFIINIVGIGICNFVLFFVL